MRSIFSSGQFLCSTIGPFLRPDLQARNDAARRRCQGWPALRRCHKLRRFQAILDSGEHGVILRDLGTER